MAPAVPKKGNQLPATTKPAPVATSLPPEAQAVIEALAKLQAERDRLFAERLDQRRVGQAQGCDPNPSG